MNTPPQLQAKLSQYVDLHQDRLLEILQTLVRIPSENTPPVGAEQKCQTWIAEQLKEIGWSSELYDIDHVPGLPAHPLFHPGRDYRGRPNLASLHKGTGGGRSLLLTGHIDTVPRGTQAWTRNPFSGYIEGNRLYGRGSNDMKGGVATNLFVAECVAKLNLPMKGDLLFESVVDEEFGGANGTLAGRLRGHNADAVILSEPSSLRICPAQRGGQVVHLTFRNPTGGVLQSDFFPTGAIPQLTHVLGCVKEFAAHRLATFKPHELYLSLKDPVPVVVTKVFTGPWGFGEPITVPESAQLEMYWQFMPGETGEDIERDFQQWLRALVERDPRIFPSFPDIHYPVRCLPASAISVKDPLVTELTACAVRTLGLTPAIQGIEGPCDMFIFQQAFQIPAVIFGARGSNTHAADEYVEIDSLVATAKTLLLFVAEWCGLR